MNLRIGLLVLASVTVLSLSANAFAKRIAIAVPPTATAQAMEADVVVTGKVLEIEKEIVEAAPFKGAPKDQRQSFKVAVVKIDQAIIGGTGLTQIRIGFPSDAVAPEVGKGDAPVGGGRGRPLPGRGPVALVAEQEGVFFLTPNTDGDFYTMTGFGGPINKKEEGFDAKMKEVMAVAKTLENPVTALKAKTIDDRYKAALVLMNRYQRFRGENQKPGEEPKREPIPADESKLIVQLLIELPWMPKEAKTPVRGGVSQEMAPCRMNLWGMINPQELGYEDPKFPEQVPGGAAVDYNKIMDESSLKFLKANQAKIQIRKFADGK